MGNPVRVVVLPVDPYEPVRLRDVTDTGNEFSELVGGGLFDVVHSRSIKNLDVWVNDEGLLMNLPENQRAMIATLYPGPLVGPAFASGGVDGEGNTLSITDEQITALEQALGEEVVRG